MNKSSQTLSSPFFKEPIERTRYGDGDERLPKAVSGVVNGLPYGAVRRDDGSALIDYGSNDTVMNVGVRTHNCFGFS